MKKSTVIILVGIILAIAISAFWEFKSPSDSVTGNVVGNSIISNTIPENNYLGLYKPSLSLEGYRYCNFVFSYENEKYVLSNEGTYKKFCNFTAGYPNIYEFLYNEYSVDLEKSEDWQFSAWYSGEGKVILNDQFKNAKNLDLYLAHEIAHSSTENINLPTWLNEGIAGYASYRFFGTQFKLNRLWLDNLENWDPNSGSVGDNIRGYTHSGFVIRYYTEKYGDDFIRNLLKEVYGKISYSDTTEVKNQKVLSAFKKVTGNESLTMEDILCKLPSCS